MAEPLREVGIIGREIGIIGGGRVAAALASSLGEQLDVALHARHPERVRLSPHGPSVPVDADLALVASRELIIIAVSDDAIPEVARALAAQLRSQPRPAGPEGGVTCVLHTSGATTGARSLAPLLEVPGVEVGSVHPLLAVPSAAVPGYFTLAPFVIETSGSVAAERARALVEQLEGEPIELPDSTEGTKARYHALATMVATGTVTLVDRAADALGVDAVQRAAFRDAFGRLAMTAAVNVSRGPGPEVLTGPVARGDGATLELHDRALEGHPVEGLHAAVRRAAEDMVDRGRQEEGGA